MNSRCSRRRSTASNARARGAPAQRNRIGSTSARGLPPVLTPISRPTQPCAGRRPVLDPSRTYNTGRPFRSPVRHHGSAFSNVMRTRDARNRSKRPIATSAATTAIRNVAIAAAHVATGPPRSTPSAPASVPTESSPTSDQLPPDRCFPGDSTLRARRPARITPPVVSPGCGRQPARRRTPAPDDLRHWARAARRHACFLARRSSPRRVLAGIQLTPAARLDDFRWR